MQRGRGLRRNHGNGVSNHAARHSFVIRPCCEMVNLEEEPLKKKRKPKKWEKKNEFKT
jgi:hypothetical protein